MAPSTPLSPLPLGSPCRALGGSLRSDAARRQASPEVPSTPTCTAVPQPVASRAPRAAAAAFVDFFDGGVDRHRGRPRRLDVGGWETSAATAAAAISGGGTCEGGGGAKRGGGRPLRMGRVGGRGGVGWAGRCTTEGGTRTRGVRRHGRWTCTGGATNRGHWSRRKLCIQAWHLAVSDLPARRAPARRPAAMSKGDSSAPAGRPRGLKPARQGPLRRPPAEPPSPPPAAASRAHPSSDALGIPTRRVCTLDNRGETSAGGPDQRKTKKTRHKRPKRRTPPPTPARRLRCRPSDVIHAFPPGVLTSPPSPPR